MYRKCQNYSWFIGKWQVVIRLYMVAVYTILEAYWILLNQKCSRQQLYGSPLPGSSAALETWLMYTARSIPRMLQHSKTAMIKIKYPFTWASFSLIHRFQAALWNGWSLQWLCARIHEGAELPRMTMAPIAIKQLQHMAHLSFWPSFQLSRKCSLCRGLHAQGFCSFFSKSMLPRPGRWRNTWKWKWSSCVMWYIGLGVYGYTVSTGIRYIKYFSLYCVNVSSASSSRIHM